MREIDRRLSETDRNEKDLPAQLSQNQQETADAAQELAKLQTLQQAYEKEAKTFTADALSARQNRLRLANKLEYFVVRAQAEDTLEQGKKSLEAVEHLAPSSQVEDLLRGPGTTTKSDASMEQMRECIKKSGDVQACRQAMHQE
jgi:chromosome segregation ATPase